MIKICHISTGHSVFDTRIFYRECKTLADSGYEVYLVATHRKEETVGGVHIIPLPLKRGRFYRFLVKDFIAFEKAINLDAKVYHFHDPELIFVGILLKIFTKAKVVYDVHENVSTQVLSTNWIPIFARKSIGFLIKVVEYLSIGLFDGIVVAGKDIKMQEHFKKFLDKIILLRNLPVIKLPDSISIFLIKKDSKIITFIYSGGLTMDRGILEIVKAAESLKSNNFKLVLLGSFNSLTFKNRILSEIKFSNKIEYVPTVPYKEMFKFLVRSHVGLICFRPTLNNLGALSGRSNKIYEYLDAGLAVIGSDFPLWRKFILENKIGVVVNPLEIDDIAKAMKFFIEHPEKLKRTEKNAKKLSSKYSWESESKKLLNLYKELLK